MLSIAEHLAPLRRLGSSAGLALRGVWLVGCLLLAFHRSLAQSVQVARDGDLTFYSILLPLLAAVTAIGVARRRIDELPIHDRQTDGIVGGLILLVALLVHSQLMPRFAGAHLLLRLDLLAANLFLLGGCVLLFGLRPTGRFWPSWLLLFAVPPLAYRIAGVTLGGGWVHRSLVMVAVTGIALSVTVGRTPARAVTGFIGTVVLGTATVLVLSAADPHWPRLLLQMAGPVVGGAAVGFAALFTTTRRGEHRVRPAAGAGPRTPMAVVRAGAAALAVAAGLSFIVPPAADPRPTTVGPAAAADGTPAVPTGWQRVRVDDHSWVSRYFGDDALLTRQQVTALQGDPRWDSQARPRTLMVDTLTVTRPAMLAVYPVHTLYPLGDTRISAPTRIGLGHDVHADLYSVVDDDDLLTWNLLTFQWRVADRFQRITVVAVDDHRPGADFPQPVPSMASEIGKTFTVLLRGNAVRRDDDPAYKDAALLTEFGRALVADQYALQEDR